MFKIIRYLLLFILINMIFNALIGINPMFRYVVYIGLMFYFFSSMRFVAPRSRPGNYTYQEPINPTPRNNGDVIDVEFTEREDKSGN